jgi:hypothetical protein
MHEFQFENFIDDLESIQYRSEFFDKLKEFNESYIEKHKDSIDFQGTFPFGSVLPPYYKLYNETDPRLYINSLYTPYISDYIPDRHYVQYYPPRLKEIYPYQKHHSDLEYWKEKRKEYLNYLNKFL